MNEWIQESKWKQGLFKSQWWQCATELGSLRSLHIFHLFLSVYPIYGIIMASTDGWFSAHYPLSLLFTWTQSTCPVVFKLPLPACFKFCILNYVRKHFIILQRWSFPTCWILKNSKFSLSKCSDWSRVFFKWHQHHLGTYWKCGISGLSWKLHHILFILIRFQEVVSVCPLRLEKHYSISCFYFIDLTQSYGASGITTPEYYLSGVKNIL